VTTGLPRHSDLAFDNLRGVAHQSIRIGCHGFYQEPARISEEFSPALLVQRERLSGDRDREVTIADRLGNRVNHDFLSGNGWETGRQVNRHIRAWGAMLDRIRAALVVVAWPSETPKVTTKSPFDRGRGSNRTPELAFNVAPTGISFAE
jgi:hypothetical protein